jgi:photosystem II stability/assembly factor-like uncharacterized protein
MLTNLNPRTPWWPVLLALTLLLGQPNPGSAQWQPLTQKLIETEKPGFGKLCGVVVDPANGDLFINLSDKGFYLSKDQGRTWKRTTTMEIKGRTEWPGCLMLDPTRKTRDLVTALVYGAPIGISSDAGASWRFLDRKSSHVDWCVLDWTDPDRKFILTLKHESGGLLLVSRDGGKSFEEVGKGYGPAWIFDGRTAVVAEAPGKTRPRPRLLRSTDAGKTFTPCGEYRATALPRWRDGLLYWVVDGALITTADRGQTWTKAGDLKDGRCGPVFGKDSKHLFVLTGSGIVESTDGGASWSKPLPLPREMGGSSPLSWLEYDPGHDVLYVMKMGSDLFKLERRRP